MKFRGYSRVIEFEPRTVDDPDKLNKVWEYKYTDGSLFVPTGPEHQFNSAFVSSAQRLPNGNTFITEGMNGRLFEVKYDEETQENTIVWEYLDGPGAFGTMIYRAYRVPPEWVPGNPDFYEEWDSLYYPE